VTPRVAGKSGSIRNKRAEPNSRFTVAATDPPAAMSPTRSTLPAAALALAVVLAGCSAAGVTVGAPDPYTETGAALDGDALAQDHADALLAGDGFTATTNVTVTVDEDRATVNRTAAVDAGANRSLARTRLAGGAVDDGELLVTRYTENDTTARRVLAGAGTTELRTLDAARAPYDDDLFGVRPVDAERATGDALVAATVGAADWTQRGVERHDGAWVTRYEATAVSDLGAVAGAALTDADLARTGLSPADLGAENVSATLLVGPDGVVRELTVTATGTTDDGATVRLSVTFSVDPGAASVERPGWYGEATDGLDG
jgi:hypothetical protein